MDKPGANTAELEAAKAFSLQSTYFDAQYESDAIIQYKRKRVRQHVLQYLQPGNTILELNAGTGNDAIFFAQQGYHVHATDISEGMQEQLAAKADLAGLSAMISHELCSYTALEALKEKGPYNYIFSNFAGLNCTGEVEKVLNSFDELLVPGGYVTLVMLPKFCLWETLLIFKGKFKTATRRFFSSKGRKAKIDGMPFTCWYYSPHHLARLLKKEFDLIYLEGLCTIVPPSYIENFAEKHPKVFSFLRRKEDKLKAKWPWRLMGDYFILTLRKRG